MSIAVISSPATQPLSVKHRRLILRAHALFLLVASVGGMCADLAGVYLSIGPQRHVLAAAPYAGIGFVEAHGLALILGCLLWNSAPTRRWHLTGLALGVLLGTCNLAFWQLFIAADMLVLGYVTTAAHWTFAVAHAYAAASSNERVQ